MSRIIFSTPWKIFICKDDKDPATIDIQILASLKINKLKWQKCWVPSDDNDDVVGADDSDDDVDATQLIWVRESDDQGPNTLTPYYKVNKRPESSDQLFEGKINTCKFLQIKYFPPANACQDGSLLLAAPPLSANLHGLGSVMDKTWFNYAECADQDIRGVFQRPQLFCILRNFRVHVSILMICFSFVWRFIE